MLPESEAAVNNVLPLPLTFKCADQMCNSEESAVSGSESKIFLFPVFLSVRVKKFDPFIWLLTSI